MMQHHRTPTPLTPLMSRRDFLAAGAAGGAALTALSSGMAVPQAAAQAAAKPPKAGGTLIWGGVIAPFPTQR
jgi:anaerobic selenocysteine-containing dehydrogenase